MAKAPYQDGRRSFYEGFQTNPYKLASKRDEWQRGYDDAEAHYSAVDGLEDEAPLDSSDAQRAAEITELVDAHRDNMREVLARFAALRNAVLAVLEFRAGDERYPRIRDTDDSRRAILALEKAVQ